MNIEIANRLVQLRKKNGLSQEALAEQLGISRQAVSKWERAEASPDTDNLMALAKLYRMSLDELLMTAEADDTDESENSMKTGAFQEPDGYGEAGNGEEAGDYVHVGLEGVHVRDKDGSEVHVGWDGIHVDDRKKGDEVHVDRNGVYVNGTKYDREWIRYHHHFPFAAIIVVLYIVIGSLFGAWHPGWLLFLLIPLWYGFWEAVRKDNAYRFPYPVLAALVYLGLGLFFGWWHPGWVVFLTIPVYYWLVSWLSGKEDDD